MDDNTNTPAPTPQDTPQNTPQPAPETTPAPETGTPPQPDTPSFSQEAFDKLNAAYSLSAEPENTEDPAPQKSTSEPEANEYTIAFPEEFNHPDASAFDDILRPIAQQSGMDGQAFGKLFADSYAAIENARNQAEWQNRFRQDAELKRDWGADYEANIKIARQHCAYIQQKAGLSAEDMAVFSSPKGMRALYALASAHGSPAAAGLASENTTEVAWAKAVMQPGHSDHDAFVNPMNPRYREVNRRWLRAHGQ